jgi:hypothetical protein
VLTRKISSAAPGIAASAGTKASVLIPTMSLGHSEIMSLAVPT